MSMVFSLVVWTSLSLRDTQPSQEDEETETYDFSSNLVLSFLTLRERTSNSSLSLGYSNQPPKGDGLCLELI
jgi:hypothetical protein